MEHEKEPEASLGKLMFLGEIFAEHASEKAYGGSLSRGCAPFGQIANRDQVTAGSPVPFSFSLYLQRGQHGVSPQPGPTDVTPQTVSY